MFYHVRPFFNLLLGLHGDDSQEGEDHGVDRPFVVASHVEDSVPRNVQTILKKNYSEMFVLK